MEPESRPFLALAWMLGAVASFSLMAIGGREISETLNTFELMLYRSVIGFVIVCAIVATHKKGFAQIKTERKAMHVSRNITHYFGQNLWFYGITVIPLSQLVALEFTNPIWVALLAPFFLGEALTKPRIIAALLGFAGVLVVARPGIAPIEIGHLAGLGAAIGFAFNTLLTKQLMRTETVLCVMFWMTLMQATMSLFLSLPGGIPVPEGIGWLWILLVSVTGLTAHFSLSLALAAAPASVVAPMEFIRLPTITAIGFFLYDESLAIWVVLGALLIIAGNLVNIFGETRKTKKSQAATN